MNRRPPSLCPPAALLGLLLGAALLGPPAARAHLSIIRQGPESRGVIEAGDRHGQALAAGDFDGDGFDDLAMGSPHEDLNGLSNVGAVIVNFGSRYGVTHAGSVLITAQSMGAALQAGARFGFSLASADFDADGYDDLAIGVPWENIGAATDAGVIHVLRGSASGLQVGITLDQSDGGGSIETGDRFGNSFATGNFDGDAPSYMDLAVGSPGEDSNAGAVFYFLGSSGLLLGGSGWFKQADLGGTNTPGDRFGHALAAGNFVGTSHDDLVASAPYKQVGASASAGAFYLMHGTGSGPAAGGYPIITAASFDAAQANGWFGLALAGGRFFSGGYDALAIGEPGRSYGTLANAGRAVAIRGGAGGFDTVNEVVLTQSNGGATVGPDELFGRALAGGRYWDPADGYDDLAVGSPGEGFGTWTEAGLVQIFTGGPNGPSGAYGWSTFNQGTLNETVENGDDLGFSVAYGRFDDSGRGGLAAGASGEDADAGMVHVIIPWRQTFGLSCRHSVAYDCLDNLVFSQKPFDQVSIASTTKTMTVLIAAERTQLPPGDPRYVNPNAVYTVPDWVADNIPGSQVGLLSLERITLIDLMYTCMMRSGNDAAFAIADLIYGGGGSNSSVPAFVGEMNQRAAQLGMASTHFHNPAGLDNEPVGPDLGQHYSTPVDMARLSRAAMNNPLVAAIAGTTSYPMTRHFWWELGQNYLDFPWACNNIFTSVMNNMIQPANGIKGGWTSIAKATGLFSAEDPIGRIAIAGHYYTPNPPSDQTYTPNAAALLQLGLAECDYFFEFFPVPSSYIVWFPGMRTVQEAVEGATAEVLFEADDLQFDVFRPATGVPAAALLEIGRTSEVLIRPRAPVELGVQPFYSHGGIRLFNMGTADASISVELSYEPDPYLFDIRPGEAVSIPAYASPDPGGDFLMTLENLGADDVELAIEEPYGFDLDLPDPAPGDRPVFSAFLRRGGEIVNDGFEIKVTGRDPEPGTELTIAAHGAGVPVSVEEPGPGGTGSAQAPAIALRPAAPNPFHASTSLSFDLAAPGEVGIAIYDVAGRRVRSFGPTPLAAGRWGVSWNGAREDGAHLPQGTYFYRVALDGRHVAEGKVTLLR